MTFCLHLSAKQDVEDVKGLYADINFPLCLEVLFFLAGDYFLTFGNDLHDQYSTTSLAMQFIYY